MAFAVLLSRLTAGLNTVVNRTWNGTTNFAVARGSASAKFLGTSSPTIIDSSVAKVMARMLAITVTAVDGSTAPRGIASHVLNAGSRVYPASNVVRVMPS